MFNFFYIFKVKSNMKKSFSLYFFPTTFWVPKPNIVLLFLFELVVHI